jgi:hypothetical protein
VEWWIDGLVFWVVTRPAGNEDFLFRNWGGRVKMANGKWPMAEWQHRTRAGEFIFWLL